MNFKINSTISEHYQPTRSLHQSFSMDYCFLSLSLSLSFSPSLSRRKISHQVLVIRLVEFFIIRTSLLSCTNMSSIPLNLAVKTLNFDTLITKIGPEIGKLWYIELCTGRFNQSLQSVEITHAEQQFTYIEAVIAVAMFLEKVSYLTF